MNKLIIPIIITVILAAGIGAYFVLQKPAPELQTGKCGDGVCDEVEKTNPSLCPQDCQDIIQSLSGQTSQDSPFAIHGPFEPQIDSPDIVTSKNVRASLEDLRIKWVRERYVQKDLDTVFDIVNIYSGIGFEGGEINPKITGIPESYKQELKKVIQKNKDRIKIWHVQTEPDGVGGWFDNPKGYANLLKASFKIIKEECPDCRVAIGGLSGIGNLDTGIDGKQAIFLKNVLEAGGAGYFDAFEFKQHHHSQKQYLELGKRMKTFRKILADYGIDIDKMPVFIETAMYEGDPNDPVPKPLETGLPIQSEKDQAIGLIKTYVYGLSIGIDKIFWNLIYERTDFEKNHEKPFPQNPFNHYGLINNPDNDDGQSHKKLSYYTYKKMVEILEGSDWNNIQTIQESNGIYIYKFTKNNKPIWVAWNDNSGDKQITISGITSSQIKITEAVPKYDSGKDVIDYNTAFKTETETVSGGKASITLKENPVFVEEK